MKFSVADIAAMLDALGEGAVINGASLRVIFQAPAQVLDGIGGLLVTDPTAVAADNDLAALGIEAGEYGSQITIAGMDYRILAVVPDGSGFSTLTLDVI
jgi:hypothetical protein